MPERITPSILLLSDFGIFRVNFREVRKASRLKRMPQPSSYERIYTVVAQIPRGRVATYGQIAELAGLPDGARQAGYALSALGEGTSLPWHRVVNARGEISARSEPGCESIQRILLEHEGVRFSSGDRIPLGRYRWRPEG